MFTLDVLLVFIALGFILYSLYFEVFGPSFTFLVAVLFLGIFGILEPKEILEGFGNEQVAIIIMLLLLGDVIRRTTIIEAAFDRLFRNAKSFRGFQARMMIIVAAFSSILNNTPLVAVMMPYVDNWCKRNNYSVSKFLIPLSFAAILGGSVTLIGTSTNLIVNGMVVEQKLDNLPELNMFDFVYVGIPMMIIGILYILFIGHRLLPGKDRPELVQSEATRNYLVPARIRHGSSLIGKKLNDTELRNIKGLELVEYIKKGKNILSETDDIILEEEDNLVFSGDVEKYADMLNSSSGLVVPEVGMLSKSKKSEINELIVSQNSSLIARKLKNINFRASYDAAALAIHRNGEQLKTNIQNEELRAGDVLLIYAGEAFDNRTRNSHDFYFLTRFRDFVKIDTWKIVLMLIAVVGSITLSALHIKGGLFFGLMVVLMMSLLFRITSPKELPKGIDYDLGLIIVMSLALGTAMIKTGTAELIADALLTVFQPLGAVGALFGVYFITTVLAAYITNKASVGIVFPIAIVMAENLDIANPAPFVLTVAYASAANFMTPIGYQTNLMVYGPGKYSFKDFFRIGFPLTILYMLGTVLILSFIFKLF
ncbi:MAG: anion permease [Bacteroidales bacterium]|nr:anion permease [Bacteroidales bacterium]MBN2820216.1 anion permease [Bacteroidales bacterium]